MRFVVLGNPEGKRVGFFQRALETLGRPAASVVSWLDFFREPDLLGAALAGADPVTLRVESTGKDWSVQRELIALGADQDLGGLAPLAPEAARGLGDDTGRVRYLRQGYEGFRVALRHVRAQLDAQPAARVMTAPEAIELMFDKTRCHAACEAAGVPVPPALQDVRSYEDLRAKMDAAGLRRVFVKPAHASSASGVLALQTHGPKVAAQTSVELVREGGELRLYNSRKIRKYMRPDDVAAIVDALAPERVQVEAWLPKAKLGGLSCDLRCVVIGGRAQHAVVRTSKTPLTNLHLLNPRGELDAFQALVGPAGWAEVQRICERATAAMGHALYAGVDLCVTKGQKQKAVLEVNAFGDLLPRIEVAGRDTYAAEVLAALEAA